jgi:hypothetical protein
MPTKPKPNLAGLAQQATFECGCGTTHQAPDGNLPVGWSAALGSAWCNDCTAAGIPAREIAAARRPKAA